MERESSNNSSSSKICLGCWALGPISSVLNSMRYPPWTGFRSLSDTVSRTALPDSTAFSRTERVAECARLFWLSSPASDADDISRYVSRETPVTVEPKNRSLGCFRLSKSGILEMLFRPPDAEVLRETLFGFAVPAEDSCLVFAPSAPAESPASEVLVLVFFALVLPCAWEVRVILPLLPDLPSVLVVEAADLRLDFFAPDPAEAFAVLDFVLDDPLLEALVPAEAEAAESAVVGLAPTRFRVPECAGADFA